MASIPDVTTADRTPTPSPLASVPPAPGVGPQVLASAPPAVPTPGVAASTPGFAWLRDRLVSSDGSLNVAVGIYSDCSGRSAIDSDRADLDPCFIGRRYFVGHSPGVFAPLLRMQPGAIITWYDGNGNAQRFRIVTARDIVRNSGALTLAQPDVVAEFQTCLTLDGSLDRILDAVRA